MRTPWSARKTPERLRRGTRTGWRRLTLLLAPVMGIAIASQFAVASTASVASATATSAAKAYQWGLCSDGAHSADCADVSNAYPTVGWGGSYVGHDEPSLLFYSNRPGSGSNQNYVVQLPKDPPKAPNQNGTGGTDNFMLHPAFWFGMAMCDTQSFPNFTTNCPAGSDSNIFNSPDPSSPSYIGKHPGTAFMEMQFYPPGWVPWPAGNSCAATQWCAALNIDSLSSNPAGVNNNAACLNAAGLEYVNFAFITKNGVAQAPANPLDATAATFTPQPGDLFMNSGDVLSVHMFDTSSGLRIDISDLTSHASGFMTASPANGFAEVNYQPKATTCSVTPYAFHPMYATSGPDTRVPWAAHSYNVAFSDEIGHFEYCNTVNTTTGTCTSAGVTEKNGATDNDDIGCFTASQSTLYPISGCLGADNDFDGPPYRNDWPGTGAPGQDKKFAAQPYVFTSPTFNGFQRYSQVAFESDMPRVEYQNLGGPGPYCDPTTGANCVNPPPGAQFYPIFTTAGHGSSCVWRLGGARMPGTTNDFGGSSVTEYKNLVALFYPTVVNGQPAAQYKFEDFHQTLPNNPCG
jgi:hypothetical protein